MSRQKGGAAVRARAERLERLEVEYVPVESLSPNSYNPNRQTAEEFELLCLSMREDGFTQPVIAQRGTRTIVDGEHRWRAAQALGLQKVPVVFVDMEEAQRRIATLRHNRARGSEDVELTSQLLRDLREMGSLDHAMAALSLSSEEVDTLIADLPAPEVLAGEDFGEAWDPQKHDTGRDSDADAGEAGGDKPAVTHSMTPAAAERIRQRNEQLKTAGSDKEREEVLRQTTTARVVATFTGAEADLIRRIFPHPASPLILSCARYATLHREMLAAIEAAVSE
jgi:ParB/RepB/Spo0J family partition protein